MAAGGKSFHLRWNNHLTNLRSLLETLYNDQNLVDVTLSCCDGTLKAHKLMLSACSPYFETIFKSHEVEHPVVILKGISKKEMKSLIDYMYVGSLEVSEDELPNLLQVANELQIKGLIQKPKSPSGTSEPEDDVEMEQSKTPEEVESPPKEQTFRSVTQYGGGMVQPEVESEPSKELAEDKEEPMNVAQDGEIIQPATNGSPTMNNNNNNNNNNGQVKTTTQSQYIGHCLEVALNQPELQCRICKRYFNNRQNLRRHVQTHTGDKPHQCDICFISFLRLSHLQRHIRTHTGEKPYTCTLCEKSFSRSDKLKNHYIHQHSEVGAELTNKKRGRPSKLNFPGFGFQISNNTLTVNSSSQNENTSPQLTQSTLENFARNHSASMFFNSGALSLTPVNISNRDNASNSSNDSAISLTVNKSVQNSAALHQVANAIQDCNASAFQQVANAIQDRVLSIVPVKMENTFHEQVASS